MTIKNGGIADVLWIPGRMANWSALWGTPALESTVSIHYSSRMTRSLGRCYPERGLIRIAVSLLDGPRTILEEALCHELAHIAVHELNGGKCRPHGPEWRPLCERQVSNHARWTGALLHGSVSRVRSGTI